MKYYSHTSRGKYTNRKVETTLTMAVIIAALRLALGVALATILTGCYLLTFCSMVLVRIASGDKTVRPLAELLHMVNGTWSYLVLQEPRPKPFKP